MLFIIQALCDPPHLRAIHCPSHAPATAGDPGTLFIIQVQFVIFGTSLLYELSPYKEYAKRCVNSQQNSGGVLGVLVSELSVLAGALDVFGFGKVYLIQTLYYL